MPVLLETLNPAQRSAATHGEGPLLIIAGAGTGKTMTLASRVGVLIDRGVPPEQILLLTFTRRAAREMIRRAQEMTGQDAVQRVWGGTFHATANRLLRIYGQAIGLAQDFTVMDQGDAADTMNLIRNDLGVARGEKRFPAKQTLLAIYSRGVNAREKLLDTLQTRFPWCGDALEGIKAIFQRYVELKNEQNLLDYDDLLLYWLQLCAASPAAESVAQRFAHVLVDEYQDTNAVQCDILRALRRNNANLCVVGDDAQSIYSFRAATVRNILDFPLHFEGAAVIKLERNYRSVQPILTASNAVMAEAKEGYGKALYSNRSGTHKPVLYHCADEPGQVRLVCEHVLHHLEQGIPLMRQAVLFRAGHHSDALEVELARRNIPFHKFGGLKFIESAHIKDMLAFLRVLENPHDEISWFRILLMLDGIGPKTARRIVDALREPANRPLQRLLDQPPAVPPAAREDFDSLRMMIRDCLPADGDDEVAVSDHPAKPSTGPALAVQVERCRRFYEPIFRRLYDNPTMRLRDIEQLEQIATGYRSRRRFLTDLTLDPPSSTSDFAQPPHLDEDWLTLSTIHSAKGCEWDVVHVLHLADGMIPSDMATGSEPEIEEERRLLYVAMTRAKDFLYLYFPLRYYYRPKGMGDAHGFAQLSRFLSPAVRAHMEECAQTFEDDAVQTFSAGPAREQVNQFLRDLWEG